MRVLALEKKNSTVSQLRLHPYLASPRGEVAVRRTDGEVNRATVFFSAPFCVTLTISQHHPQMTGRTTILSS